MIYAKIRNKESGMEFDVDKDPELVDFYTTYKSVGNRGFRAV